VCEDRRKPCRDDRALCHAAPKTAPQLNRQHGRRDPFVASEKLQNPAAPALIDHDWNQTRAAAYLDITRSALLYRMNEFGLERRGSAVEKR